MEQEQPGWWPEAGELGAQQVPVGQLELRSGADGQALGCWEEMGCW